MRNHGTSSWTQIAWVLRELSKEEIWNFSKEKCARIPEASVQAGNFL